MKRGFDNQQYITMQSAHIRDRIEAFGGKLYLEFGGKLYDDHHAARTLPGFQPDSKLRMLLQIKEQVEMVIAINADDIEKNKVRGDLGITYDRDVIRLIGIFRDFGLYVSSVVLTRYNDLPLTKAFQDRLEGLVGKIKGLREMKIVIDPLSTSNGDILMDSTFDDAASLAVYQKHFLHLEIANSLVSPATEVRLCVDYEV